jgi:hypothetical protein
MKKDDAISTGKSAGMSRGETISVQSQGQADHPHGSDSHVDGWAVTRGSDGSYSADKIHSGND